MMRHMLLLVAFCVPSASGAAADVRLDDRTDVAFATVEQAAKILAARDDFVARLSPFDRAARLKTDRDVSEKEYLDFVSKSPRSWTDGEKGIVSEAIAALAPRLRKLSLPWPKTILMVKTTGREEGNAPYTRANAVVLPESSLEHATAASLQGNICHELFHILSRHNPALRDKLYRAIGFYPCKEIEFPAKFASRRITNPDAPINAHCIKVRVNKRPAWVTPILISRTEKYSPTRGGEFFDYLSCRFLIVSSSDSATPDISAYDKNKPEFADARNTTGLFEQVGRNTQYIIHPEEILADNFALVVLGGQRVRSPQVLDAIKKVLTSPEKAGDKQ
jgi:hypothetical protein